MVAAHFDIFVVRSLEGAGSEDAKQMWDRVQAFKLLVKCMHVLQANPTPQGAFTSDGSSSSSSSSSLSPSSKNATLLHLFPRSFVMAMAALARPKVVSGAANKATGGGGGSVQVDDPLRVPCLLALRELLWPAPKLCAACNVPKVSPVI